MIPKAFDSIGADDIHSLVTNGEEERRTLDFKRDLPGNSDRDRNELRADVTSFANASGGDLIFGVDEAGGVATDVPGLPGIDPDAEIRRIDSIIQSNVDPRVPGLETRAISIPGKAPVILLRVPRSWRGPHLVRVNDTFRMFGRNSKGKYIFDATEMRSAFAVSEQLPERIRRWRDDRIAAVVGGDTPVPLKDRTRLFIHLLPLASFSRSIEYSAGDLLKQQLLFRPPGADGWGNRINIDGVVTSSKASQEHDWSTSYCQAFRSGRVEAVSAEIAYDREGRTIISSVDCEQVVMRSVASYLQGFKELGVSLPILVLVAVSGASGIYFAVSGGGGNRRPSVIDRDMLILPDVLVESHATDVASLLRPVFDAIWNAAGWERSFNYDADGQWRHLR